MLRCYNFLYLMAISTILGHLRSQFFWTPFSGCFNSTFWMSCWHPVDAVMIEHVMLRLLHDLPCTTSSRLQERNDPSKDLPWITLKFSNKATLLNHCVKWAKSRPDNRNSFSKYRHVQQDKFSCLLCFLSYDRRYLPHFTMRLIGIA